MAKQVNKKKKKGKTPKELVKKHVMNKEDIISDEEFTNMEVGISVDTSGEQHQLELPDDKDRPRDEDKDPGITTPWDLVK